MKSAARLVIVTSVLLVLVGCASGGPTAGELEGSWVLESFGGVTELVPADPTMTTAITFAAGTASGNGGVNTFSTTYQAKDGGELAFDPVRATKMAGPPAANQQEAAFFDVLANTTRFEINDGKLVLTDPGNNALAVLAAE